MWAYTGIYKDISGFRDLLGGRFICLTGTGFALAASASFLESIQGLGFRGNLNS